MKFVRNKYSLVIIVLLSVLFFAGCSKKNRCADCPKFSFSPSQQVGDKPRPPFREGKPSPSIIVQSKKAKNTTF